MVFCVLAFVLEFMGRIEVADESVWGVNVRLFTMGNYYSYGLVE